MNYEEAKQIAEAAWDEAVAHAPKLFPANGPESTQDYLANRLDHYSCLAGYLKASIASLLLDHCGPQRLQMSDRIMDVVHLDDVPLGVTGTLIKGCEATDDDPGQGSTFEVEAAYLMGYRLPDEIAIPLVEHYRDVIDERMVELTFPGWAEDQSEGAA